MCCLVSSLYVPHGIHRQKYKMKQKREIFVLQIDDCRKRGTKAIPIGRDPVTSNVATKLTIAQTPTCPISCIRTTEYYETVVQLFCTSHSPNMSVTSVMPTVLVKCTLQAHKPWWKSQDCDEVMHMHI
jgi:hypothetical protein